VAVLAVVGIATYVSYWHPYAVVRTHGKSDELGLAQTLIVMSVPAYRDGTATPAT
jgi:hypothetical protein